MKKTNNDNKKNNNNSNNNNNNSKIQFPNVHFITSIFEPTLTSLL